MLSNADYVRSRPNADVARRRSFQARSLPQLECQLLAPSGHAERREECPLLALSRHR